MDCMDWTRDCAQVRLSAAEEKAARLDWSSREQAASLQRSVSFYVTNQRYVMRSRPVLACDACSSSAADHRSQGKFVTG